MEWAKQFGTVAILSPDTYISNLDLLILPGGKDVVNGNPLDYSFNNSDGDRFLEYFDTYTLPKYLEDGTRIFGICRGAQAIWKAFGIPILQDIYWDHGYSKDNGDMKAHKVFWSPKLLVEARTEGFKLTKELGSFHHQGIYVKDLKEEFELLGCSAEDPESMRLVEAFRHKSLPIAGVQYHPERALDELSEYLVQQLLNK
jgi:putative glutamine amidotransferase